MDQLGVLFFVVRLRSTIRDDTVVQTAPLDRKTKRNSTCNKREERLGEGKRTYSFLPVLHDECTARKISFNYSFSGNCKASVPISTFMCL
jgi:hypothetical protein